MSWTCKCGHLNAGNFNICELCGQRHKYNDEHYKRLLEIIETGFSSHDELQKSLEMGAKNKKEYDLILKYHAPNYETAEQIFKGGFNSYNELQEALSLGVQTKKDYDLILKYQVSNYETAEQIFKGGFNSYNELQEALSLGVRTKKDLQLIKKLNAPDYETAKLIAIGNFPNYDIFLTAKKLNFSTYEEYMINETRNTITKVIENLFGQLSEGDEVNWTNSLKIINDDLLIEFEQLKSNNDLILNLISDQLENFLLNNHEFEFIKLKNVIIKKKSISGEIIAQHTSNTINTIVCENCNNKILKTADFCSYCGNKINRCMICKLPVELRNKLECPNCKNGFHENHLKEYVKVKGVCPICNSDIKSLIF